MFQNANAMSKRKKFVVAVLLLIVIGTGVVYYMWNKPHVNVANVQAISVNAPQLYQAFTNDTANMYLSKIVAVSGTVSAIDTNQNGFQVVKLSSNKEGAYVNCTMEIADAVIKAGSAVVIKGICTGIGQADEEMGIPADVYLVRAQTVNSK
jgi:hypothetical protein